MEFKVTMVKKCEQCQYYVTSLYSKNQHLPDSRCTHQSAVLGKDEEGKIVSWMLVSEARAPLADEKKHGISPWGPIPCGPKALYFKGKAE